MSPVAPIATDELSQLEQLQDELLESLQTAFQQGRPLSDQLMGLIAGQLEWLTNRIEELKGNAVTPAPKIPDLTQAMPSSNVYGFAYDPDDKNLYVKFQGDTGIGEGPVYSYGGVPQGVFELFRDGAVQAKTKGQNKWGRWWVGKIPSIGAALHELIKEKGYPYQRVS
jgi:hypothetical protein